MNGQISFEAAKVDVSLIGSNPPVMFVVAEFDDLRDFLDSVYLGDEQDVLDLIRDGLIIEYLEDRGYSVTRKDDDV